jgi:glycosyltransferase involved in cell wall biosynthesis
MNASSTRPLISVLTPVFNAEAYLDEMLASLQRQTLTDFEAVLVDDGSTDASAEILERATRDDSRFRLMRLPANQGIVAALNHGLEACRGTYIARLDADDVAYSTRLERQVRYLEKHPEIVALGTSLAYIDSAGRPLGRVRQSTLRGSLLRANPLMHPTVMFRHDVLRAAGLRYRSEFAYAEDFYLWLELSRQGRLGSLDEVTVLYRVSPSALRARRLRAMLRATLKVQWAAIARLGFRPRLSDLPAFLAEVGLLALPAGFVWRLYLRTMFGTEKTLADRS